MSTSDFDGLRNDRFEIHFDTFSSQARWVRKHDAKLHRGQRHLQNATEHGGAELVQDCYCYEAGDYSGTACGDRVVRGGSWANRPELLRSAYRGCCAPTLRNHLNGFRVARGRP